MKGVYQHCKENPLHRYLAEFDFRYSNRIVLGANDEARSVKALPAITGKLLTRASNVNFRIESMQPKVAFKRNPSAI